MNNSSDHSIYDDRWKRSKGTSDESILTLKNPKTQVEFFYLNYNKLTSDLIKGVYEETKDLKLLEIGCGRATASIYLAITSLIDIYPTDYSQEAVDIANTNLAQHNIQSKAIQADLFNLPYDTSSFDVVLSLGVMEHMPDPVEAYKMMYEVLKDGGLMISMNVPEKPNNIQQYVFLLNKCLCFLRDKLKIKDAKPWLDKNTRSKTGDVYRTHDSAETFEQYAQQAGFTDVTTLQVNPFPTIDPLPAWLERVVVNLYSLFLRVRRTFSSHNNPFVTNKTLSRVHFLVAKK